MGGGAGERLIWEEMSRLNAGMQMQKRMPRVAFSAFDLRFSYHPPSGGRGISLGLVRQYQCAYGASH